MSKEVDVIRLAIESKRQNIETVARNKQLEIDNERRRIEYEIEKGRQRITERSVQNQRLFQDTGINKLLEDIRDSGLLRFHLEDKDKPEFYFVDEPIYRDKIFGGQKFDGYKKVKKYCEPPHISWSGEHLRHPTNKDCYIDFPSLHDHSTLSLVYNFISFPSDTYGRGGGQRYDSITFVIKEGVINIDDKPLKDIPDLPNYIAEKITKTIN